MLPRLRTQRATLTAISLALSACRIGGVDALAPPEPEPGDDDEISVSESPALGGSSDAALEDAARDAEVSDAGGQDCRSDSGLCAELPEGCESRRFGEHVYVFCGAELPWDAARTSCRDLGLDLVIIESSDENDFVAQHVQAPSWLGANDQATEGSFEWITPGQAGSSGAAVTFASWGVAVPDNCGGLFGQQDCVRISTDGKWDDSDCQGGCLEGTFAHVCESY